MFGLFKKASQKQIDIGVLRTAADPYQKSNAQVYYCAYFEVSKGLLSKDARNNAALLVIDAQNVRICTATTIVIEYPIGQTQYSIYKDTNELALGFGNRVFSIHHLLKFDQLPDGIVTQQTVDDLGSATGQNLTDVDQLLVTKAQRLAV